MLPLFVIGFTVSTLYKWNYIQHTQHVPDEYHIPYVATGVDHDGNHIDDGKDILKGAEDYVAHHPKYETLQPYEDGWTDGNRGSNGDVVAYALKNIKLDLHIVINQDIYKNPDAYKGVNTDKDLAFRNPKTQEVFFSRYALTLSTDLDNKTEWQAGDFIFFEKNHCAVVTDKVNEKGIRFIIHHFWEHQGGYFQDVLETGAWGKITGHYRLSERMFSPKTDN